MARFKPSAVADEAVGTRAQTKKGNKKVALSIQPR
jgi:hypothetical protein